MATQQRLLAQLRQAFTRIMHKYSIQSAYGQLIALIFVPISILAGTGAVIVLTETNKAQLSQQATRSYASLTRYQPAAEVIIRLLEDPNQYNNSRSIFQAILTEDHVKRAALIDIDGRTRLTVGAMGNYAWPKFSITSEVFGPLPGYGGNVYGQRVTFSREGPMWLVIEVDNSAFAMARYKVWLVLSSVGLATILLLLLCLNIYARRWISPIYELRILVNKLNINQLSWPFKIKSSGELRQLQKDLVLLMRRIEHGVHEILDHAEQQVDDMQHQVDDLEMQNIKFRQSRDQALRINQMKSTFLANISHELRTPLNSIDGFVQLLQRRGNMNNEQQRFIDSIQKSSAHLLALINDVLDFSKIEAGKLTLEQAPFDLHDLVYDVIDMLSPAAIAKRLNLAIFYYDDVPYQVIGDSLRVKQILTNLVSNAIKFTAEGEISIRVTLEHHNDRIQDIKISVQDTGIGLDGVDLAQLFGAFGQADASVSRQYGGTGLGLSIAKELAGLMHGDIEAFDNKDLATHIGQSSSIVRGATFNALLRFGVMESTECVVDTDNSSLRVMSYIRHQASQNVLRGYLNRIDIELEAAHSLPDLLARLDHLAQKNIGQAEPYQYWLIVEADEDCEALLKELRTRYQGELIVYGFDASLNPDILQQYNAHKLSKPINAKHLYQLLHQVQSSAFNVAQNTHLMLNNTDIHILAVDDHPSNLIVLEALLSDIGVRVTTVLSGIEALEIIEQRYRQEHRNFDVIFMDIQMPRLSGPETTQKIRQLEQSWQLKERAIIIALTAHALGDEKEMLLDAGFDDYAGKPIHLPRIVHLLNTWATPHTSIQPTPPTMLTLSEPSLPTLQTTTPLVWDWQNALELSANKSDLAIDLLQLLLDTLPEEKQKLMTLLAQHDWTELARELHRINGAARYTGVPYLRQTTGDAEILLRKIQQDSENGQRQSKEITLQLNKVFTAIDQTMRIDMSVFPPHYSAD